MAEAKNPLAKLFHGLAKLSVKAVLLFLSSMAWLYLVMRPKKSKRNQHTKGFLEEMGEEELVARHEDYREPLERILRFPEAATMVQLFDVASKEYAKKHCVGYRLMVQKVEEEDPKTGKKFEKVELGPYQWQTFEQYARRVASVASGLQLSGVAPGSLVAIYMETKAEWRIAAHALWSMGCTVVTVYATLGEEGVLHCLQETEVRTVLTDENLVEKLLKRKKELPKLNHLVYVEDNGGLDAERDGVVLEKFRDLELKGAEQLNFQPNLVSEDKLPKPADIAVIMYTSGSTGKPKGVQISHKTLIATIAGLHVFASDFLKPDDIYIAYLPLAHVLGLAAELGLHAAGIPQGYGTPRTITDTSTGLKKGCPGDISALRPTLMAAVPAIMDRINVSINQQLEKAGEISQIIFTWACRWKWYMISNGYTEGPEHKAFFFDLIFKKIRASLGGRLRIIMSGGAPLGPVTQQLMNTCVCCVGQGYGLTETTGLSTTISGLANPNDAIGVVGGPFPHVKIKLIDWKDGGYSVRDLPVPRGEVVIGGAGVADGYYKLPEKTKEDFYTDKDGVRWFKTGDIGQWYPDGNLEIVDRKKDLVKLQHGEYLSLGKIEAALMSSPYVENIMMYADPFHKFAIALVVPNKGTLKNSPAVNESPLEDPESLYKEPALLKEVQESLEKTGKKGGLSKVEIPQRIYLVPEPWTPENEMVTAAMKLRRENIKRKYKHVLTELYE